MPIPETLKLSMNYLDTYTYSCAEGYSTSDELCVVCLPDGTLSIDSAPTCYGKTLQLYLHRYFLQNYNEFWASLTRMKSNIYKA